MADTELSLDLVNTDSFQKTFNRPGGFRYPGEPEECCRGFQVFDKDMTAKISSVYHGWGTRGKL